MLRPSGSCIHVSGVMASLLVAVSSGCGSGTVAALSGGGSDGGTNAPPAIAGFRVVDPGTQGPPRTSPAEIRFVLSDLEGNPAQVEFLYHAPGFAPEHLAHLTSLPGNPVSLTTSVDGTEYALAWEFAAEDVLPDNASFTPGVLVYARVAGSNVILVGANAAQLGLGNDAPLVQAETPPAEVEGIVPVRLHLSDSSSDPVDVRVEYDVQGDQPDTGWRIARPGGILPGSQTPPLAFEDIVVGPDGADIVFFWDTGFDLHALERDAQLRVTPIDPVVEGTPAVTNPFRVDNNAAPLLQLHMDAVLANPDSVRGILVPFTMSDEEQDEITVVFQWRREGELFPDLPSTPALIEAVLADEDERRDHHVCSQYPRAYEGRAVQLDATHVQMPELSGGLSFLVQQGLAGRELEILRPKTGLVPVSVAWDSNPFVRPVAALSLDGGVRALVLDESPRGAWTLSRVRLLDGVIENTVASGSGAPGALCFERDEASVLVASSVATAWQVTRVVLASGATTALAAVADGPVEQGLVRGLASVGSHAAVLTVGGSLVRVDWSESMAPRAAAVLENLETPWGVVVDPRNAGWVLVAENDAPGPSGSGRVVAVELSTGTRIPVVIRPNAVDGLAFPRPRGIAVERKGTRLLAVCETDPFTGRVELRSVELGRADTSSASSLGQPLGAGSAALSASAVDDTLLSTSGSDRLVHVAGGVERRATIEEVEGTTATARLASAFTPALDASARWRVAFLGNGPLRVASSPQGLAQTFLWDSADVPGGGNAFLRATPLDADFGQVASSTGPKPVSPTFAGEALVVASGSGHRAVVQADLDADGDLDLVSANLNSDDLQVFWQTAPGAFDPSPTTLGGPATTPNPASVQAADLDGDGDLDLVSGNYGNGTLTVFWQTAPGAFDPSPTTLVLPGPIGGGLPAATLVVQAADLEPDGDLDLVCTNYGSDSLVVFWQTAPGLFDPDPTAVGGTSTSAGPICVQAADLDLDGDLDLVSANLNSDDLTVFWQTGPGVFAPVPTALSWPTIVDPFFVQAADLDLDGDLDLVSVNGASNTLTVFWQSAPGTFGPMPTELGGTFATFQPVHVEAADLDGDGDLDLVCASSAAHLLAVFWQTAPRIFDRVPTTIGGPSTTFYPFWVQAADLDGDGDLDLVSASLGQALPGSLAVSWQTAPGAFDPTPTTLTGVFTDIRRPFFVQAADLDGDGDLDLVSGNYGTHTVTVFWQTAPGIFGEAPTSLGGPATTFQPSSVQAADLDGDGDLDLVSANLGSHTLTVFWQTAPGLFDPAPITVGGPSTMTSPRFVEAVDLDGDGDLDLVSANAVSDNLTVFWQTATGVFDPSPTTLGGVATTDNPRSVQAADLDGDGDLDLVSANFVSDTLTVFWQTAPGRFDPTPTPVGAPTITDGPDAIEAIDLDGDGDLDLVSANFFPSSLTVFRRLR